MHLLSVDQFSKDDLEENIVRGLTITLSVDETVRCPAKFWRTCSMSHPRARRLRSTRRWSGSAAMSFRSTT